MVEILSFMATWVNLNIKMLSEFTQRLKDTGQMISLTHRIVQNGAHKSRE